jgi:hypothetical protein
VKFQETGTKTNGAVRPVRFSEWLCLLTFTT